MDNIITTQDIVGLTDPSTILEYCESDDFPEVIIAVELAFTNIKLKKLEEKVQKLERILNTPGLILEELIKIGNKLTIDQHGHDLLDALFAASTNTMYHFDRFASVEELHDQIAALEEPVVAACSDIEEYGSAELEDEGLPTHILEQINNDNGQHQRKTRLIQPKGKPNYATT